MQDVVMPSGHKSPILYLFTSLFYPCGGHYACVCKCACLAYTCRCQGSRSGVGLSWSLPSFCPLFRDSWSLHWAWGLSIQLLCSWDLSFFGLILHVGSKNLNSGPHAYAARLWAIQWVFICYFWDSSCSITQTQPLSSCCHFRMLVL